MNREKVPFWDSCVFIDRLQANNEARIHTLRAITDAAELGHVRIITSSISLAEVCNPRQKRNGKRGPKPGKFTCAKCR